MKRDQKQKPDSKRGFPGLLLLFIVGLVVILAFQNLSETKVANVSFSHQVEHLVNLDLLDSAHNRKTANNDHLVTFSGKFKETISESSKQRYRYINLLHQKHELASLQTQLSTELNTLFQEAQASVQYYLMISSTKLPVNGFEVVPKDFNTGESFNQLTIKDLVRKPEGIVTIRGVKEQLSALSALIDGDRTKTKFDALGVSLQTLVTEFSSEELSVSKQSLKVTLANASRRIDQIANEPSMNNTDRIAAYSAVLTEVEGVSAEITTPINGVNCYNLRYVRNYVEKIEEAKVAATELRRNALQLSKARTAVLPVIWFVNNVEKSTNQLEKLPPEDYQRWYAHADKEWKAFDANLGLAFRAPDQITTLPLEKTFKSEEPPPNYFSYLFTFMPILLVGLLLYFIFSKQVKGGGSSAMNFGKSPAKMLHKSTQTVTFDDVQGISEAKEELVEVVEFLRHSARFTKLGARIPKGVLLIGPPGTGKTLLAKAVAGEAGVPFFSISGSDFVEMFVGVGASRVRDLFEQAKKSAPCIIFIDEIDAVGRHRGSGMGGGHDEREQTLNQLLVEIDGMGSEAGIIVIAATNRFDVLDQALLRPGRFDRTVQVDKPDFKGRFEILKVHAKKVKMAENVDLKQVAGRTSGLAGADLENIINEAAIYAGRKWRSAVILEDLLYSLEKVQFGKERKSLVLNQDDLEVTAWHEAGHTVIAMILQTDDDVTRVTVIPRGNSLGATHFQEKRNRVSYRKSELIKKLVCLMGGRVAEEIIFKDITNGAKGDIMMATAYAKAMVVEWGMSEEVGMICYGDDSQKSLMAGFKEREHSEDTALKIDHEIKRFIDEAYVKAHEVLNENFDKMKEVAEMLLMFETLDKEDVTNIMEGKFDISKKQAKIDESISSKARKPPPLPKRLGNKKLTPKTI